MSRVDVLDAGRALAAVRAAVDRAIERGIEIAITDATERIKLGITASGGTQQQNTEATRLDKLERLGHTTPLVDSGYLADEKNWTRQRTADGMAALVPQARELPLDGLARYGYKMPDLSDSALEEFEITLDEELSRIDLDDYTEREEVRG